MAVWGPGAKGNEIIERLVRLVAQAFCADEEIVVVHALLHHGKPLPATSRPGYAGPDLRKFVRIREQQQIHDILNRLKRDHIVSCMEKMVDMSEEEKRHYDHMSVRQLSKKRSVDQKPMTFWFIDFKGFFEHTLYKVDLMRNRLEQKMDDLRNSQAYFCPDPNCGMVYDINDFGKLDRTEGGGFLCGQCQLAELEIRDNRGEMEQAKVARSGLEHQLRAILDILDNGPKLCFTRNAAVIDNSLDVMTREQYAAERAATTLAPPTAADVPYAQLEVAVVLEGDPERRAKRLRARQQEGEKLNKEKIPPWLKDAPDVSYAAAPLLTAAARGPAVPPAPGPAAAASLALEARALRRFNALAKQQKAGLAKPPAGPPRLDPEVYAHYVDALGLRPKVEAERQRRQRQEFVSVEEYLRDPHLPAGDGDDDPPPLDLSPA